MLEILAAVPFAPWMFKGYEQLPLSTLVQFIPKLGVMNALFGASWTCAVSRYYIVYTLCALVTLPRFLRPT